MRRTTGKHLSTHQALHRLQTSPNHLRSVLTSLSLLLHLLVHLTSFNASSATSTTMIKIIAGCTSNSRSRLVSRLSRIVSNVVNRLNRLLTRLLSPIHLLRKLVWFKTVRKWRSLEMQVSLLQQHPILSTHSVFAGVQILGPHHI